MPQFIKRHARFGCDQPCFWIPGNDLVHSGQIHHHACAVERSVIIGTASPTQCDFQIGLFGKFENFADLLRAVPGTRFIRDATRGGVATVLNEIAEASQVGIEIVEKYARFSAAGLLKRNLTNAVMVPGDALRIGGSELLSFSPTGTATSGTLYLAGRTGLQYAVRVLGATGRIRTVDLRITSALLYQLSYTSSVARSARWCLGTELNRRHRDFQSRALPTELPRHRRGKSR